LVPSRPIIEKGEKPFAMLQDLWIKHRDWVFEPIYYSSVDARIGSLDEKIIRPAEGRLADLLARKAQQMKGSMFDSQPIMSRNRAESSNSGGRCRPPNRLGR
jgi:hypothetical protein